MEQLKLSMEEREREIGVHKDVLISEMRRVQDEKHKVAMELADRANAVKNLKVKFEALVKKNKDRVEGEDKSQA